MTRDLLPPETAKWQHVEERLRSVLEAFAFREARPAGDGPALARLAAAYGRGGGGVARWYVIERGEAAAAIFGAPASRELEALVAALGAELEVPIPPPSAGRWRCELEALVAAVDGEPESFQPSVTVLVAAVDEGAAPVDVAQPLRLAGVRTAVEQAVAPAEAQLAAGARLGARVVVLAAGAGLVVHDTAAGTSEAISRDRLLARVRTLAD